MVTIIPCLEVMKSVTDNNIDSAPSKLRVEAFQLANELIAEADAKILMPSQLYDKIALRLNAEQKNAFETLYTIDKSTQAVATYDLYRATKLVADAESKARPIVIILGENIDSYAIPTNYKIKVVKPQEFIDKIKCIRELKKKGNMFDMREAIVFSFLG